MIMQWKWQIFKGLALIDRVPEELWTEDHNIVHKFLFFSRELSHCGRPSPEGQTKRTPLRSQ